MLELIGHFFSSKIHIFWHMKLYLGVVYAIKVWERKPIHMENLSLVGDASF
jgi:hypothetical protein